MTMKPRQCELEIRPAGEPDVPAIQQVAREAWEQTYAGYLGDFDRREIRGHMYSERALREDIGLRGSHVFAATVEGAVVAFGEFVSEGSSGEVVRIAVAPAWQRQGIATALLNRGLATLAADGASEVTTGIEREDEPARSFFEAHGFRRVDDHGRDTPREMRTPDLDLLEYARSIPQPIAGGNGWISTGRIPVGRIEVWCDDGGRICPRCRRRYAEGVRRCETCGVSLLANSPETPERPRAEDHRFVPLFRTADESRITFVSTALEGSGIAFSVHPGEAANGAAGIVEIWVPPGRADEAREVIERLDEAPVVVEDE